MKLSKMEALKRALACGMPPPQQLQLEVLIDIRDALGVIADELEQTRKQQAYDAAAARGAAAAASSAR